MAVFGQSSGNLDGLMQPAYSGKAFRKYELISFISFFQLVQYLTTAVYTHWCHILDTQSCCSKLQRKLARDNATLIHPQPNWRILHVFISGCLKFQEFWNWLEHRKRSINGIEVLAKCCFLCYVFFLVSVFLAAFSYHP